jgi:hypothetical protein
LVCCSSVCVSLTSDISTTMTDDDEFLMNSDHSLRCISIQHHKM